MFYAKKAALRLDQQRVSLRRQHKSFLADLAKSSGQSPSAAFSERIERLRLALRQSMIENIKISRAITRRIYVLNMGSMAEATLAQKRLSFVYNDIAETLNKLATSAER